MIHDVIVGVLIVLASGAITSSLFMWRDIAVLKRDVDALALFVGTPRAKARNNKADK